MYNTSTAVQGGQLGGIQSGNAAMAPKPTVTVEIINRLEHINGNLHDIIVNQRNLIDRLHGPRPETPCSEAKAQNTSGGLLQTIDERLGWIANSVQEITDNQNTLSRLA